jgi:hypothetical protein
MSDPMGTTSSASSERRIMIFDLDQQPHSQQDIDLLFKIYQKKRIEEQSAFYQSRVKENNKNADFTFAAGALVMTISSLVATISASVRDPFWTPFLTVMSAMLPAFAALLASFRQLYGWERQASIYRDALLGLERVRLLAPDEDRISAASLQAIYPELVTSSEKVFTGEVSQWGQFVVSADQKAAKSDETLEALFSNLELNDSQRAAVQAILSAGKPIGPATNVTATVVKQVTATTTPAAPVDMTALAAAASSEVDGDADTTIVPVVDPDALAAAASSEVGGDDVEDIVPPNTPLPHDDVTDNSAG